MRLVYGHGNTCLPAPISGSVDIAASGGAQMPRCVARGVKDLRVAGRVVPDGCLEIWAHPYIESQKT